VKVKSFLKLILVILFSSVGFFHFSFLFHLEFFSLTLLPLFPAASFSHPGLKCWAC